MRARAICVCHDDGVRSVVGTALAGAGVAVDHHRVLPAEPGEVALFVVDRETRRALPPGEVGEILVRGHVTPGYYKDPDKNAAAFDRDGFLITGDLGSIGDDGRLRFRGRIKEMVKTGGINVAPLEVEEVLLGHPAVEQAYVVGLPDPRKEEILAAIVVLRVDGGAEPEALRAFCRRELAAFKVPEVFRVLKREELPVTATGKVQKFRLATMLGGEGDAAGA